MRYVLAGLAVLALAGCDPRPGPTTPAEGYVRMRDRLTASLGIEWMFPPCEVEIGGPERVDRCYRLAPPQRWSGVWANEFEGSRFCPGAKDRCPYRGGNNIWLEWSGPAPAEMKRQDAKPRLYRMAFIGRRTLVAGAYGHMGMSRHYILVDRVLSAELVPIGAAQ